MTIGFGSTVLENCLVKEHMDGVGVYASNLYQEFSTSGITQKAVTFGKEPQDSQTFLGKVIHLPLFYYYQSALSIFTKTPFIGSSSFASGMDFFFAPDHFIPYLKHLPVVATIMDTIPLTRPDIVSQRLRKLKNFALKKTVHWADHVITISEHSKRDIIQYCNIDEKKISIVPLGVNEAFFQRVSEEKKQEVLEKYGLKSNFFITVGTLQPRKNMNRLIEAFELLPDKVQSENALVIVGKYGWGEEVLLKRLKSTQLNKNIHWLHTVKNDDLYALLQSSAGLIFPSLYEGFGLPLLEGFASQIPVVTSNTTSLPEVGKDAVLYVNPLDSNDIFQKMSRLLNDSQLRKELVSRGINRVKQFTWKNSAKEHIKVFKSFIDGKT